MLDVPVAVPSACAFLAALPATERWQIERHAVRVRLVAGQVLHEAGAGIEHAYVIDAGCVVLTTPASDGGWGVEVGIAGPGCIVGVCAALDPEPQAVFQAVVLTPGAALRLPSDRLHGLATDLPALRLRCHRAMQADLARAQHGTACAARHGLHERMGSWLLAAHERAGCDDVMIMQEVLSRLLGVRRSGVTAAMTAMENSGLIRVARGRVRVLDAAGLDQASCGCWRLVRDETFRLMGVALVA